ncbi:IS110 family transposase [Vibrio crassostreae]|uniref:IS110 family transposase n=1 Tax=Vibrio crassostreae TaxID=246167 RepID=UPI0040692B16
MSNAARTIGVDLAKNVIQVSGLSKTNKVLFNKELSRAKFAEFVATYPKTLIAFEACSTAHYWARFAKQHGHNIKILPAKVVASFRQGHKTDKNDALAVAETANRPNIKEAPLKTLEQQAIQSIQRSREHLVHDRTSLSNHLRGLLMEFGIFIPKGFAALRKAIPEILEDAENGVPDTYRATLHLMYSRFDYLCSDIKKLDAQISALIKHTAPCQKLLALEGVGPISAILLFSSLGTGEAFSAGREFSAYLGLTPKQHSSGGKINLVGISRFAANKQLRSVLIQGARAYINKLKFAKTQKDKWLLDLIERAGFGKAAVALANKNARTAWALLTQGTDYNTKLLV